MKSQNIMTMPLVINFPLASFVVNDLKFGVFGTQFVRMAKVQHTCYSIARCAVRIFHNN